MKKFLFIILMSIFALGTSTAQNGKYTAGIFSSGVNCETEKAYFDIKIKATDANSHFRIAESNFRFSFRRSAFVEGSSFIESELDLSGPLQGEDGSYSIYAHTLTGSLDTVITYNLELAGGTGYTIKDDVWTSVGRIGLGIKNANICTVIDFHDEWTIFPPTFVSEFVEDGLRVHIMDAVIESVDICLSDYCNSGTSSCLPEGITLSTQKQIDDFAVDYPGCTEITGSVIIEETTSGNIMNLDGLSQLTTIGGNLEVKNNAALTNLYGLENLNDLSGNLIIENNATLYDLNSLVNVDDTKIADLQITNNASLAICHIKNVCNYLSNGGSNKIAGNATGCDDTVAVSNACSTNACTLIDLRLTSQQQIDNFATNYPNCTQISGNLTIDDVVSNPIINLKGLSQLVGVGGILNIQNNPTLSDLSGLDNITTIGGLHVELNGALTNLSGLNKVTTINKDLNILNNDILHNLIGLNNLTSVGGHLTIEYNDVLNDLTGLDYLETVGGNLIVNDNYANYTSSLKNIRLNNLVTIGGDFEILYNKYITHIEFKKLTSVAGNFKINFHVALRSLDANNLATIGGSFYLESAYALDILGLAGLNSVGGDFIVYNTGLSSLSDLSNLQSISGKLFIRGNYALQSLNGLHNIDPAGISDLTIVENRNTSVCSMTNICTYLASGKPTEIYFNGAGCDSEAQIRAICTSDEVCDYNSTLSLFSDDDIYIDSKGFDNNPVMTFTLPATTSQATFSDISLKLYLRLSGNSCEDDIAIQITDPVGNTHPLKAYTTCDGGTNLRQIILDVPNTSVMTNTGNWTVQFDDTNDQNSGDEYSVKYGKLSYTVEGGDGVPIPVSEKITANEGKDINISSGGFNNNPSIELAVATPPNDAATVSNVALHVFLKVFGNSCKSDIALRVTTPEGYTFPLTPYNNDCTQQGYLLIAKFDIPDTYFTDISGIWLIEFDDTNPHNQTVEYAIKHVRLQYIADYVRCINASIHSNKNLDGSSVADSNMKKQTLSLDEDIRLYPIPTGEYLNIDYLAESEYPLSIEVMSNDGKSLMTQEALLQEGINTLQLNVHQLPAGHYYLKMYSVDKAPQMKSFVKVNQKQ